MLMLCLDYLPMQMTSDLKFHAQMEEFCYKKKSIDFWKYNYPKYQ